MTIPPKKQTDTDSFNAFLTLARQQQHHKGSTIIHAGDSSDCLYYVLEGSVSVLIEDTDGHEIIVAYLNVGDFFGEMVMFGEVERSAWVTARSDCKVAIMSVAKFRDLITRDNSLLLKLTHQLTQRLIKTTQKVGELAFLDVTGRIARTLLDLSTQPDAMTHPDGLQIKVTRQELGRIAGCSREMAGRVLKTLENQGLVRTSGKTMVILRSPD